jgi:hypothetical protein
MMMKDVDDDDDDGVDEKEDETRFSNLPFFLLLSTRKNYANNYAIHKISTYILKS